MPFFLACAIEYTDDEPIDPPAIQAMRWESIAFVCDVESLDDALKLPTDDPAIVSLVMHSGEVGTEKWTVSTSIGTGAGQILPARLCGPNDVSGRLTVGWLE